MSLARKYVNLKEPYNEIKEQVITIIFFKRRRQNLHEVKVKSAKGVFQIQSPICGVNFLNNISITQVRDNDRKV